MKALSFIGFSSVVALLAASTNADPLFLPPDCNEGIKACNAYLASPGHLSASSGARCETHLGFATKDETKTGFAVRWVPDETHLVCETSLGLGPKICKKEAKCHKEANVFICNDAIICHSAGKISWSTYIRIDI